MEKSSFSKTEVILFLVLCVGFYAMGKEPVIVDYVERSYGCSRYREVCFSNSPYGFKTKPVRDITLAQGIKEMIKEIRNK